VPLRFLRNAPIRLKLVLLVLLTTGGALAVASAILVTVDRVRFQSDMEKDLTALAEIVARNTTAALSFNDEKAAAETLSALNAVTSIEAAAVYGRQGEVFARFVRPGRAPVIPARPGGDEATFTEDALVIFRPVKLNQERIGTVYLRNDLEELAGYMKLQVATVGAVFLLSGLTALALSSGLQRVISRPVLHLADTARAVSEQKDYSLRAEKKSDDELGHLVDAFNEMLMQIQERNGELQQAKGELERRVQERTVELERRNEELHQSNKELDDFAYIASHDLKEPLRGIHNFSTFLLEDYSDKLDDDGRSKLETLTRLTRRMETLIDSLLHFSRLGRVDLAIDRVDLNAIVGEVVDSLGINLEEAGVEVRVPRPLPAVQADRARVGEIFHNLIINAMKYNDKAEKWIEVGYQEDGGGAPPVFHVRDNGIGIPEKHFESVFRIFKRLHGRDKFGGGTGAGLTIVKKIIERHNGKIWVESTHGLGTTFYFTLERGAERS
jgi:signal transduction histidine kinase